MIVLVYIYITLSYSIIKDEQASLANPFLMDSLYQADSWLSRTFFVSEIFLDQWIKCQDASPLLLMPSLYLTVFLMSRTFFQPLRTFRINLDGLIFLSVNSNEQATLPHSLWAHYTLV